jgi:hypothetical protein
MNLQQTTRVVTVKLNKALQNRQHSIFNIEK